MITQEPDYPDENPTQYEGLDIDLAGIIVPNKHALRPTLKEVQRKMRGFDESLVMYVYHHMNGREYEAQTYLDEWEEQQNAMREELQEQNRLAMENMSGDNKEEEEHVINSE